MDIFEKYKHYYKDPIARPQPTDFLLSYFKNTQGGFFVDVGANDGITWSNSLALSELHGWEGICIEANPSVFKELLKNRPGETCLNIGSHSSDGILHFRKIHGYAEMLSGFLGDYDAEHKKRMERDIKENGGGYEDIEVKTETLYTTLTKHGSNKVDYLSIDVEGSEIEVLKGIDLNQKRPKLISVEDNGYTRLPHKYLENNNYRHIIKVAGDSFYEDSLL